MPLPPIHKTIKVSLSNVAKIGNVDNAVAILGVLEKLMLTTKFPKDQSSGIYREYERTVTKLMASGADPLVFRMQEVDDQLTGERNKKEGIQKYPCKPFHKSIVELLKSSELGNNDLIAIGQLIDTTAVPKNHREITEAFDEAVYRVPHDEMSDELLAIADKIRERLMSEAEESRAKVNEYVNEALASRVGS